MNFTIVQIEQLPSGAHGNQTTDFQYAIPEGWAFLPENIATPETENYPFADIETFKVRKDDPEYEWISPYVFGDRDEIDVVSVWTIREIPDPPPAPPAPPIPPEDDTTIQDIEDVLCNMEIAIDERLSAIEEALCELDPENNK